MVNPYRGEAELVIGGVAYVMRLPLGVLAELEAEMKADSLMDMVQRFEAGGFSARDLISLLKAGLRGGGNEVTLDVDGGPIVAAQAAAKLLAVTFAVPE
ncbi:MAG: hypothetical protein COA53_00075 [Rhodobacteraceae bacterium]|nr:MAG: hypothetical protein COA53_00075 [Paracoccaceae bacterium]